jgi:TonB family protein
MRVLDPVMHVDKVIPQYNGFSFTEVLYLLYFLISFIFLVRLVTHLIAIACNKKMSANSAFSFFKRIVVAEDISHRSVILKHEECHARQWHSADVLFFELLRVFFWINPAIYGYQKAVKSVHEYLADQAAIKVESKAEYAKLLLHHALGAETPALSNSFFNGSLLKRRIKMLLQEESSRTALLKYALSMPLLLAMLVFSSAKIEQIAEKAEVKIPDFNIEKVKDLPAQLKNTGPDKVVQKVKKPKKVKATTPVADTLKLDSLARFSQGRIQDFKRRMEERINYPDAASKNEIGGEVVLSFNVKPDGVLTDIHIIKDIGYGCGDEAVRLLKLSPPWISAVANGERVDSRQQVTINFDLKRLKDGKYWSGMSTMDSDAAQFKDGGMEGFKGFLLQNINVHTDINQQKKIGKIIVGAIIERDGSLSNIEVSGEVKNCDNCAQEVLKAIKMSPDWLPGSYDGKATRTMYEFVIDFQLFRTRVWSHRKGPMVTLVDPSSLTVKSQ